MKIAGVISRYPAGLKPAGTVSIRLSYKTFVAIAIIEEARTNMEQLSRYDPDSPEYRAALAKQRIDWPHVVERCKRRFLPYKQ
jgi:hypothetical protein